MTQAKMSLRDLSQLVVVQTQNGKSKDQVVKVLMARGWPEVSAVRFVDMTLFEQGTHPARERAPMEGQQSVRGPLIRGQGSPLIRLVVVLCALGLIALLILSMLSVFVG
jgi:hypothetical protein